MIANLTIVAGPGLDARSSRAARRSRCGTTASAGQQPRDAVVGVRVAGDRECADGPLRGVVAGGGAKWSRRAGRVRGRRAQRLEPDVLGEHERDLAQDAVPGDPVAERRAEHGGARRPLGARASLGGRRARSGGGIAGELGLRASSSACLSPTPSWPSGTSRDKRDGGDEHAAEDGGQQDGAGLAPLRGSSSRGSRLTARIGSVLDSEADRGRERAERAVRGRPSCRRLTRASGSPTRTRTPISLRELFGEARGSCAVPPVRTISPMPREPGCDW